MKQHHTTVVARVSQWLPTWEVNVDLVSARSELALARTFHAAGHPTTALEHAARALSLAFRTSSPQYQYHALLMHAWLSLESGHDDDGLASLQAALELGRENGYARLRFDLNNFAQSVGRALQPRSCEK
jgi:hypothetical protein